MLLKEIELDLPYEENRTFIEKIIEDENLTIQEARLRDYNENWKDMRRKFQLSTRCMTSFVERLCCPIKNIKYRKVLIECVGKKNQYDYKNMLGVCVIQLEVDYMNFFSLSETDKKKEVLNIVMKAMSEITELTDSLETIKSSIIEIAENAYENEWYWHKTSKCNSRTLKIKIKHKVEAAEIYMTVHEGENEVFDKLVATTLPDEWAYMKYLGSVAWESKERAYLIAQNGDKYLVDLTANAF